MPYAKQVTVMLGALCHDFGKPATTEFFDGKWRSHAHDEAGIEPTLSFLDTLGIFTLDGFDVREQIVQLVRYHLLAGNVLQIATGRRRVSPSGAKGRAGFAVSRRQSRLLGQKSRMAAEGKMV